MFFYYSKSSNLTPTGPIYDELQTLLYLILEENYFLRLLELKNV